MKAKTLAVSAVLAAAIQFVGAQEYLEPEPGPLSGNDDYSVKLREVFATAYEGHVVLRAIIMPSFQSEEVVGIRKTDHAYQAFSVTPTTPFADTYSIWARETGREKVEDVDGKIIPPEKQEDLKKMKERVPSDFKDIKMKTQSASMPPELEQRIEKLWQKVLLDVRHPIEERMILDGVGYHFDMWILGRGVVSGQIGTPDPNSKTGRFVDLTMAISGFAKGKISEKELSNAIKRLESIFEKPREQKKVSQNGFIQRGSV